MGKEYLDAMERFSINLEYLLKTRKVTQTELAKEIGKAQSDISKYISGAEHPSIKMLLNICEFFEVSPDAMLYYHLGPPNNWAENQRIKRPLVIPQCAVDRYSHLSLYMYYYNRENEQNILREGNIKTKSISKNGEFIHAKIETHSQVYETSLTVDYPRYVCLHGKNVNWTERLFLMFADPVYSIINGQYQGGLAVCISEVPTMEAGRPSMQFVALSSREIDLQIYRETLDSFLLMPRHRHLIRLHRSTNNKYVAWMRTLK